MLEPVACLTRVLSGRFRRTSGFTALILGMLLAAHAPAYAQLGPTDAQKLDLCSGDEGAQRLADNYMGNSDLVEGLRYQAAALNKSLESHVRETAELDCDIVLGRKEPFYSGPWDVAETVSLEEMGEHLINTVIQAQRLYSQDFTGHWECESDWNAECEDRHVFTALPGFQACRFDYSVASWRGRGQKKNRVRITPQRFVDDEIYGRRFLDLRVDIRSLGSGELLDRYGGNIKLRNLSFTAIKMDAPVEERVRHGCEIWSPPAQPLPTRPDPTPLPSRGTITGTALGDDFVVVASNPGPGEYKVGFNLHCKVPDRREDSGFRWKRVVQVSWKLRPNATNDFTYRCDDALDWRFVSYRT